MHKKNILFLSTNGSWGGSEVLWSKAAEALIREGIQVSSGTFYGEIEELRNQDADHRFLDLSKLQSSSLGVRFARKLSRGALYAQSYLEKYLQDNKPDLVVISQGNNIDGKNFMLSCIRTRVKFVTITQLVTKAHWYFLNDRSIEELTGCYARAARNYFVATESLRTHEQMMGSACMNAEIIFNPFTKNKPLSFTFPNLENGYFKIALLGRHELFHKGYDLLLDVLAAEHWKNRMVKFNIYGEGPHTELLSRLIKISGNPHVTIQPHNEDVESVWRNHHLLMMPSRMEGQSLSLIEAMRYNRAAIVTKPADNANMVDDGITGFVAADANIESVAEAMERAWDNRENWESMGKAAGRAILESQPLDAIADLNQKLLLLLN